MKILAHVQSVLKTPADVLAVGGVKGKFSTQGLLSQLDQKLNKELSQVLKAEGFEGKKGQSKLYYAGKKLKAKYVLVLGLGETKKIDLETIRACGAMTNGVASRIKAKKILFAIEPPKDSFERQEQIQALLEGFLLSQYQFLKYLKKKTSLLKEVRLACATKEVSKVNKAIKRAQIISDGVCLTRDLVNTPAVDMTPLDLGRVAKKIKGVRTSVHPEAWIKKMKMGAFLSVAAGSTKNKPCFIEMVYKPTTKPKKKIALIGKGVTFDTGGYSIKPAKGMENMKDDMAGAAAVIGLMSLLPKIKPKVEVRAYIAATENMVDGFARVPGDVCKAMNGTTIEIVNTDAEGRLTMADALVYANKKKPDYMIDVATLTGHCLVALGTRYTGVLANDQKLCESLIESGKAVNEKMWQLPLVDEYRDELKSPVANLRNTGTGYPGTITAGIFLENFVGKTKWAHLDIAGPSWTDKPLSYTPRGGTGVMVRTFLHFLEQF